MGTSTVSRPLWILLGRQRLFLSSIFLIHKVWSVHKGTFHRPSGLTLCGALSSEGLWPVNFSYIVLCRFSAMSPHSKKSAELFQSTLAAVAWKLSQSSHLAWKKGSSTFCYHLSGITVLHCLVSSALQTVFSCILSVFLLFQMGSKHHVYSYSLLTRSRSHFLSFLPKIPDNFFCCIVLDNHSFKKFGAMAMNYIMLKISFDPLTQQIKPRSV